MDHAEVLATSISFMDGDRHDQSRNVARHLVEYDVDRLVIPIGVAGPVVARVLDRTACAPKLTVKNEITI